MSNPARTETVSRDTFKCWLSRLQISSSFARFAMKGPVENGIFRYQPLDQDKIPCAAYSCSATGSLFIVGGIVKRFLEARLGPYGDGLPVAVLFLSAGSHTKFNINPYRK
ncbi:hypothetical protein H112_04497 [Trichophyton rubrum D6]|uniref:Uncharacterized protein n=3 Tax=Trichophyton TaxID=5550 RepID=A0A080WJ86_TRIRC|nr:uncharacterized protein TERG_12125 [Trichophyton rubrum CBS 118892]XP_047606221.1 uncharacterized protein TERG_12125 [Trichophyton rubrum CBS 118892]EZF22702.1 hypothetical protein H100_04506 [Trichophyton rubrum MR850]EZF41765.1 hypothetical protein H102_04490 [Trichophyton rubrum CBS 100081]EZF52433.1 hypothetical protein H103_04502 [Trichophyton rubrum CBS 288.86]EZF63124.1 hypothetical protein H104_04488 [Trichophyton rubrum CBS 289.86]EZF73708.1 hypothetical protein H105_04514 [Tricho